MRALKWVSVGATVIGTGLVMGGLNAGTLNISGNSVPTNFIVQNGRVYVPLADVAKALQLGVSKSGNGYVLAPSGGANQVQGLSGKVGQTLNCGYSTLKIVKVLKTNHYKYQFANGYIDANNSNEDLYVVQFHVKNATNRNELIGFESNSALVDNDEHSYRCYSGPGKDLPGNELLPGSATDFALTFSIPKTETPVQLVYQVYFYQVPAKELKTFRIDLAGSISQS